QDGQKRSLLKLMSLPGLNIETLAKIYPAILAQDQVCLRQVIIAESYRTLYNKTAQDIKIYEQEVDIKLPLDINYDEVAGLSNELKIKLKATTPINFAEAKRIQGMTPAAIIALHIHLKKIKAL